MPALETNSPHFIDGVRCFVVVAAVLFFCTGFDLYGYTVYSTPNPTLFVAAVLTFAVMLLIVEVHRPLSVLRSPVLAWVLAVLVVSTVWAWWTPGSAGMVELLTSRYKSAVLLASMLVVFDDERARRAGAYALAAVVIVISLLCVAEAFGLMTFTDLQALRIYGRSSAFFTNANEAARAIVFPLSAAVVLIAPGWRLPLLILAAPGLAFTFSRASWIAYGVLVVWLLLRRAVRISVVTAVSMAAVALLLGWGGGRAERFLESTGVLNENTTTRMRLGDNESTTERLYLADKAWQMFASAPVTGNGLGASLHWEDTLSSHNTYLNLAADHGLVGLLLFPMLCVALIIANRRLLPFTFIVAVGAFFTHNLIDERYVIVTIAFAGAVTRADVDRALGRREERTHANPLTAARSPGATTLHA